MCIRDRFGGVIAGVAGVAILVALIVVDGLAEGGEREVADGIGFDEAADFLDVMVGGDQLGAGGRIDAIEAGRYGRRAGDAAVSYTHLDVYKRQN